MEEKIFPKDAFDAVIAYLRDTATGTPLAMYRALVRVVEYLMDSGQAAVAESRTTPATTADAAAALDSLVQANTEGRAASFQIPDWLMNILIDMIQKLIRDAFKMTAPA